VRRFTTTRKGFDCTRHPCGKSGCGRHPGSNHGIACDLWEYAVSDGDLAVSLSVSSGVFPESVPAESAAGGGPYPAARAVYVHAANPLDEETVRSGAYGDPCDYLGGGRCYTDGGRYNFEEGFFGEYIGPERVQSESFWRALEGELNEVRGALEPLGVAQCSSCAGRGAVGPGAGWTDSRHELPPHDVAVLLWVGEPGSLVAYYDGSAKAWRGERTGRTPDARGPWFWRPLPPSLAWVRRMRDELSPGEDKC
jgi:hypothetical protein